MNDKEYLVINDSLELHWKDEIQSVLDGEKNSVKLFYARPHDVVQIVENLGGKDEQDFDQNGWQWDYWMYFSYENKRYMLAGDGYYQHYSTFSLEE